MHAISGSSSSPASRHTTVLAISLAIIAFGFLVIPTHKALAASDTVNSAVYQDNNNDGYIDTIVWTMNDIVTACPYVAGNWSVPTAGTGQDHTRAHYCQTYSFAF